MPPARSVKSQPTGQSTIAFPVDLFDLWIRSSDAYLSGLTEWVAEAARFSGRRIEQDRTTICCLRDCSTWSDMASVQAQWATTAIQDYLDEFGRAGELLRRSAGAAEGMSGEVPGSRKAA